MTGALAAWINGITPKSPAYAIGVSPEPLLLMLKGLAEIGVLVSHGRSVRDPRQYYDLPEDSSE